MSIFDSDNEYTSITEAIEIKGVKMTGFTFSEGGSMSGPTLEVTDGVEVSGYEASLTINGETVFTQSYDSATEGDFSDDVWMMPTDTD